jgi:hypothetical protein
MAGGTLRVLFCIGVNPAFFDAGEDERGDAFETIKAAFADLRGRFDVQVLGTMDDDQTMVGSSASWPWTCYILADAPNLDAVAAVCNLLRATTLASGATLWKYLKIEARVGRELFFGNQ